MKWIGVAGIMLATSLAMMGTALVLMTMMWSYGTISLLDMSTIGLCWSLFLTLILCIHYHSIVGIAVSGLALIMIFYFPLIDTIGLRSFFRLPFQVKS